MRQYINLVEAVQKGCPIATHDITLNLKNRQKAMYSLGNWWCHR